MPNWVDFKATIKSDIYADFIYDQFTKNLEADPRMPLDIGNKYLYDPSIKKNQNTTILTGVVKWNYTDENFKFFIEYIKGFDINMDMKNIHIKVQYKDEPNSINGIFEFINCKYIHKYIQEITEIE